MLFNPSYLEAFNSYHMFDIYGIVYLHDLDNPYIDKSGDGWSITYGKSRLDIGPYYFD